MERLTPLYQEFSRELGIMPGGCKPKSGRNSLTAALAALSLCLGLGLAAPAAAAAADMNPRVKPAAPMPAYLSVADKERLLSVRTGLKARNYKTALAQIETVSNPIARELGYWMYFMAEDPNVDFNLADAFLDSNPDWPARARIHAFVEKKIPDTAPAADVLAFFDTRDPVTGAGKLALARALFSVGDKMGGERFLRDAWINDNFKLATEQKILSVYGGRLTPKDHAERVDRLLWGRQVTNARRVFPYLDSRTRRAAEVRAALLVQASNGKSLFNKLPDDMKYDSGMLHDAVRHFRRRGDEGRAIKLATKAPTDPEMLRNPGRWWDERNLLMRWAIKNGRFADAYALAAESGLVEGGDFADAEFYAGWIALRFLHDPLRAETHFLALASEVGSPISVSRAQYWLGRAAAAQGETDKAQVYYQRAAEHYYSYYGQLAAEEAGGAYTASKFAAPVQPSPADRALFTSRPTVAALRMLTDLDLDYEFMVFAYHVDDQLERPGEYVELANITKGEGAPHLTVRAGKVAIQRGAFAPEVAYPVVFVPEEATRFVSPEIVLGLSRQESEFNPRAFSRAGARGMMQLIPTTAQITARKEGLPYIRSALLDDPIYNMTLGAAHISHLLQRYEGSLILTFAAYNAGAARVDQWLLAYGDPRSDKVDPLDWVELIPFSETRNYVQRVLENVQVYRGQLKDKPIPGRLYADLERGGPRGRTASEGAPSVVLAKAAADFGAQTLPPVPERTILKARRYALAHPPVSGGANGVIYPQSAGEQAAGAAPIAFAPESAKADTSKNDKRERRNSRRNRTKPVKVDQSAPAVIAQEEPRFEASTDEGFGGAGKPPVIDAAVAETPARPNLADFAEANEIAHAVPSASASVSINPDIAADTSDADALVEEAVSIIPALASEENDAEEVVDAVSTEALEAASETPLIEETVVDAVDDLSVSEMSELEYCLAMQAYMERNREDAGDLNAASLAEFQGEEEETVCAEPAAE